MNNHLLPPNASGLERAASEAMARLDDIPVPNAGLWSADDCPAALLPWLAWALSVDVWSDAWSDYQKRETIRRAADVHRHKGTAYSVRRALEATGKNVWFVEWWQTAPAGVPHTFEIYVQVDENTPLLPGEVEQIAAQVDATKPLRSHYTLHIYVTPRGTVKKGAATVCGDSVTVLPYWLGERSQHSPRYIAAGYQDLITTEVYPHA